MPLAALDNHISELVPFLLRQADVQAVLAGMTRGCWWAEWGLPVAGDLKGAVAACGALEMVPVLLSGR